MPALLPLNYDVLNKRLVMGFNNSDPFFLPQLIAGDTYTIEFSPLLPTGLALGNPFSRVAVAGLDLRISVGTEGQENAAANVWDPTESGNGLTGSLALTTALITALASGTAQIFQIRLFDGVGYNRGRFNTTIYKSVDTPGGTTPVPGDTSLGSIEAARVYVQKEGPPGAPIILQSRTTGKRVQLYVDDVHGFRVINLN